MLVLPSTEY